ncbi:uncharacterized [Tachysurus ichikawai]
MPWSSPSRREADAEASPFPGSFPGFPWEGVKQEPDALIVRRRGLRRSHPTSTPTQQMGYANLTMCVFGQLQRFVSLVNPLIFFTDLMLPLMLFGGAHVNRLTMHAAGPHQPPHYRELEKDSENIGTSTGKGENGKRSTGGQKIFIGIEREQEQGRENTLKTTV